MKYIQSIHILMMKYTSVYIQIQQVLLCMCTVKIRVNIHTSPSLCSKSTGWRRPTGCHKLQVIFGKRANNYRALLWKMTYKERLPVTLRHPVVEHTHCIYITALYLYNYMSIHFGILVNISLCVCCSGITVHKHI